MSASDPRLHPRGPANPAAPFKLPVFVNTNAVLRKAIQQLPPAVRQQVILRCDELAQLQIAEDVLEKAFVQLLAMIAGEKADSKLFLHITCQREKVQEQQAKQGPGGRFIIQFHTNLTPPAAWLQAAEQRTSSVAELLLPYGGSLVVNQLKNSGCVFSITLPGK
jgi:hypothetical protein